MRVGRILTGLDLGEDTEKVLAYAALFARGLSAPLHLLHVMDYIITPPAYLSTYMEEEKKIAEKKFLPWQERLENEGVGSHTEIVIGRLHESFSSVIHRENAGMLVLGFRSHTFRRSSSEGLIKGLGIPLLVVRGKKAEAASIGSVKIRKILCPVDFSLTSQKALETAKELKELFSSEMEVIHVFPGDAIAKKMETWGGRDRAVEEFSRQAAAELKKFLSEAGLDKEGKVVEGEPHKKIASFSSENDIDLIVIGARGLSFIEGMLIGSVTDAILKSSPCPVLVIH